MDVKTAFLYGNVKEEIYVRQPDGFSKDGTKVCKLKCLTSYFHKYLKENFKN